VTYFGLLDNVAVLSNPEIDALWRNEQETVSAVDRSRRRLDKPCLTAAPPCTYSHRQTDRVQRAPAVERQPQTAHTLHLDQCLAWPVTYLLLLFLRNCGSITIRGCTVLLIS